MRARVCVLIISWVLGILAGVFQVVPMLVGACALLMLAIAYHMRLRTQFFIAVIFLVYFGYLYGVSVVTIRANHCQGEISSTATLVRVSALSSTQSQYVFKRNDGCSIMVSTTRFPVFVRGTLARISGSQAIASVFYQDDGIDLVVKNANVEVLHQGGSLTDKLRNASIAQLLRLLPEQDSSIAIAMLLGDRGGVTSQVQDVFRMSGISHILAISGLHVSILIGLLVFVMRYIPWPLFVRTMITISVLWIYIASIGMPLSAIRAGAFWSLYMLAYRARALVGLPTVLIVSLALFTTIYPRILLSPGFQLSVCAVFGIFIALKIFKISRHPIFTLFLSSLGATIGTIPLILYYFNGLSVFGVFVNMVILPVIPALLLSILLALIASPIFYPFALLMAYISHMLFSWIFLVVNSVQYVPYSYIDHIHIAGWVVFAYYACVSGIILYIMHKRRIAFRELWI